MTTPRPVIWTFFYGTIMNPAVMKDFGVTVNDVSRRSCQDSTLLSVLDPISFDLIERSFLGR